MKRECNLCGSRIELTSKTISITKAADNADENDCKRIICPHYSVNEVNSNAYERYNGSDECFKRSYSCINCMHRFYSPELDGYYCIFDYLDKEKKEMYYLQPLKSKVNRKHITIRYWICPVCKGKVEISIKEK